jgi:hypothetical protein
MQVFVVLSTESTDPRLVEEAVERLTAIGKVVEQKCPPTFAEWYDCPAVREPSGEMIFGLDGIKTFIERRMRPAASL